ncbi:MULTISPECIES: serine hydrolase domain-containing protein [Streptomyces]|uniref:serine hydrolase domain-containing protein n=1 Tax=Streptomyces TaxID=1883 RepID=UPI0004CDAD50|nr:MULTISPECIES: serine hydrolase domain-containing protein [Streptomyces]KOT61486.1 peptidase [Streptomyces rimosus subsp. rimosus]
MKQRTLRTALLALTTVAALATTALTPVYAATPAPQAPGHEATRAALRQLVEAGRIPGVAAEVRDGKERWFGSAGVADVDTGRKRSVHDRFRAASITKPFIATVLLQLEAEGQLSLDDTVDTWLPGLVRGNGNDGRTITVRRLLNHTSGLPSHTGDREFQTNSSGSGFPKHRYDNHTPEELVAIALKYPPVAAPGEKASYSNTNYVLAGMVIEAVTGNPYADEVERRIIEPLRLRGTSFPGSDASMPDPHPVAYSRLHDPAPDAPIHDATEQNMTWLGASGDMISTLGDLNTFQRALLRGELLPRAQMRELLDAVPAGDGFAFGLGVETITLSCGVPVVGKTGRTNGSMSATVSTRDGGHRLTFNMNGDWLADGALYVNVIEAEFCGKIPAPADRRSGALPAALAE